MRRWEIASILLKLLTLSDNQFLEHVGGCFYRFEKNLIHNSIMWSMVNVVSVSGVLGLFAK